MGKPWFRVKKFGYGVNAPCSWEGWAAIAALIGGMIGLAALPQTLIQPHPWLGIALRIGLIVGFIVLVWRKRDQPWSWRSGK